MLNRLKTAAQGGANSTGDGSAGSSADGSGKWGRRGGGRPAERDQFRVQQQGFYVRGDLTVDVFQARGLRLGTAAERNPYCVLLVERGKIGETPTAPKTVAPVWNHPVRIPHESVRRAADTNVWPVPYQPLTIQVWDRSNTSDTLLGTARVPITEVLGNSDGNGWYKLVGTGDQAGVEEVCGKIRVKVHWESETFKSTPEDQPRLFLRDVFSPSQKDYQHLYFGGLSSTMLCPPPGEEVLLEMMLGISRHDITANNHGKGVEGMLVLTELRLLFLPDIGAGSTTASFLEFNTVQVYLAAVRNFSHRGLEGGDRLLSITTRDGRFVHFRMPALASSARCGAWFDAECPQQRQRLQRLQRRGGGTGGGGGESVSAPPGSGGEELWKRGLWGAGSSELWMERLVDEIRWRKASGDFVALWHKLHETSANPRAPAVGSATSTAPTAAAAGGGFRTIVGGHASSSSSSSQYRNVVAIGAGSTSAGKLTAAAAAASPTRGDLADGGAALERDLERMGVPTAGGGGGASYAAFGRQMWEFKTVNKDYALSPTYPQMLALPSTITPAQLAMAAPQRSRSRIPALVWLHPVSKAPLCRSSQPMAGMTTKVLSEDIYLLKQIRVTLDTSKISIVDARSLLNAKANQVTGKGYEDVNDIGRDVCTLGFMGIENIHSVRDSLAAFCAASQAQGQEYYHAVGASGWLRHLAQIMKGAAFVVDELQRGVAVLVHCSDGWDRTAQLTALAQLYMDPYYRTLAGFEALVEKEWCSFGHMFGLRAHSDSPTESSPVFLQWLDAVWQVVRQYPSSFEFTGHYLERLVEGVYSAGFLNFAGNCERERKEKLKELDEAGRGALSLFAYLREHAMEGHMTAPLLNPLYRPPAHIVGNGRAPALRAVDVLRPCCELQGLEIWQSVYMRDNLVLHHREQQLSVEQGLRLQVYDFQRRIDLIEASMDRLPRGLKSKLQSSATAMSSPDWDKYGRLADQLSADQEAAAAAAAAAAFAASGGGTSRGRSQSRASRLSTNDEGSRSRSRSFNLPLRGWGGGKGGSNTGGGGGGGGGGVYGERRQRWASQDSDTYRGGRLDTDIEEESYRAISEGAARPEGSGDTSSGGGLAPDDDDDHGDAEDDEEFEERPSRSKSFFGGFGKWRGSRLRSTSSAQSVGLPPPTAAAVDNGDGGGGQRRRNSSSAASTLRGIVSRAESSSSRNNRFSSFSGERPSVVPATGPSPGGGFDEPASAATLVPAGQKGAEKPNAAAAAAAAVVAAHPARKTGRLLRSNSRTMVDSRAPKAAPSPPRSARLSGDRKSWGRGSIGAAAADNEVKDEEQDSGSRRRAMSTTARRHSAGAASLADTPGVSAATPSRGRWGRGRASSSAGAPRDDGDPASRPRALSAIPAAASVDVTPARGAVADGDVGAGGVGKPKKKVFSRTKGVWGSFQRTLGTGSSRKSTPEVGRDPHSTPRRDPSPAPEKPVAAASTAKSSAACSEKSTGSRRQDVPPEDNASAGRVAELLKAEEEAEARRQMQHTIITLEMQMLVKDIVHVACARATERGNEKSSDRSSVLSNQSSNKGAPPSVASSAGPAALPRLSGTAARVEQHNFFGNFWSGGSAADNDADNREQGTKEPHRHSAVAEDKKNDPEAIWRAGGGRDKTSAEKQTGKGDTEHEQKQEQKQERQQEQQEEGFFEALRRKIFEGDRAQRDEKQGETRAATAAATATATAAGQEGKKSKGEASPHLSKKPSEMEPSLKFTPVRAADRSNDHAASGGAGSGSRAGGPTDRSRSRSVAGAGAGAGPGTGGYSPIITIPPLPLAGSTPPANHPDAGAGGSRSVERPRGSSAAAVPTATPIAPDMAEEAAAKFGLVRMDHGESETSM